MMQYLVCVWPHFLQLGWLCTSHKLCGVGNVPVVEIDVYKCRLTLDIGEVELGVVEACATAGGDVVGAQQCCVNEGKAEEDKDHGAEPGKDVAVDGGQHL